MPTHLPTHPWHLQLGSQRDWVWRGWQVRYTYLRPPQAIAAETPALVFLHGFGAALTQWRQNLSVLGQHYPVYALDLLGFGASEKASTDFSVALWVAQVRDFCDSLIGRPVILIGHSLGALVALSAAVEHPELAIGLVLLTLPASRQELLSTRLQAFVGEIEALFSAPPLIQLLFQVVRRPQIVRSALRAVYSDATQITDELVESFTWPAGDRGAGRVLYRLIKARNQPSFSLNTKLLLQRLQLPTLLLWGEQDRVIPLSWGRQLPELNPGVELIEIPKAGHCPYDEAAAQVNQAITRWLLSYFKPLP